MGTVFEQFAVAGEDDEADLSVTKNREFMSLLEQPPSPLRECNLPCRPILDSPDCDFASSHFLIILF